VLRIVAAFMFIQNGTMKLFAWPIGMQPDGGPAQLLTQVGIGGTLETFGGGLLLLGLFTRPVAFILSGEMAVAYFRSWAPRGFWRSFEQAGMEASILFCFLFLFFWAAGPGAWSVDAWRGKKR